MAYVYLANGKKVWRKAWQALIGGSSETIVNDITASAVIVTSELTVTDNAFAIATSEAGSIKVGTTLYSPGAGSGKMIVGVCVLAPTASVAGSGVALKVGA